MDFLNQGRIDFAGQKLVQNLHLAIISLVCVLSATVGFVLNDIRFTVYIQAAGFLLTMLVKTFI